MSLLFFTTLFVAIQIKHFIVDFPLQNYYKALENTGLSRVWWINMFIHGGFHGGFTFLIVYLFFLFITNQHMFIFAGLMGLIDSIIHVIVDTFTLSRLSSTVKNSDITTNSTIQIFGTDQFLHQITYILIVYLVGQQFIV